MVYNKWDINEESVVLQGSNHKNTINYGNNNK